MKRKGLLLFALVCFLAGVATFIGSILGHAFGSMGLNVGAVIGGIIGVFAATKIGVSRKILGPKRFWPATIGGVLGFILAAIIAVNHLSSPVVPLASILLVGLGALFGASSRRKPD
jgi:glucan phosphoethanolaminetransferase (alkaline phosphatase superfamily)